MTLERRALTTIAALDPRACARRVLDLAREHVHADRAALFATKGDRLELFTSHGVDQRDLDNVRAAWARQRAALGQRVLLLEGGQALAAVGSPPVALLYLGAPTIQHEHKPALEQVIARLGPILEAVVDAPDEGHAEVVRRTYLERTPLEAIEHEQLQLLLSRNGWNVSRVAKALGRSRRALYKKLAKYKMTRPAKA